MELANKKLVLGLTGGIACYKTAALLRLLVKAGASVQVVMTEAAEQFITPVTLQALSGQPVYTSQWDARMPNNMAHIDLSRQADAIIIAPCSTDFMAKLAHGLCDDLLSTLCVARNSALLIAPAMNQQMWLNPATQRNVQTLQADGITLLGPDSGEQACGEVGEGRMLEPEVLLAEIIAFFQPKHLAGQHVLITTGATYEALDPVRGLTNRSSGKMGFAIARAAHEAGASVTVIAGISHEPTPHGVQRINIQSAQQMYDAVHAHIKQQDIFIAVAAVADWRADQVSPHKLKKQHGQTTPQFNLVQNPDILASVAALPQAPYCVGFAAESDHLLEYGAAKRAKKGVPLLVGNLGPRTFGQDENELVLFDASGHIHLPRANKLTLARQLVADIARRIGKQKRH